MSGENLNCVFLNSAFPMLSTVRDVNLTYTLLASGGTVNMIRAQSSTAQYKIHDIQLNGQSGTNFAGGDRDLSLTDGTHVWTVIPSSSLTSLENNTWGVTVATVVDVPFPAAIPFNQPSTAGANIFAKYSDGESDYTSGSVEITLLYSLINP